MTTSIHKVALAVAIATASLGAQASPTIVDFDSFFTGAGASAVSVNLAGQSPYRGLTFTNAWAFTDAIARDADAAVAITGSKPAERTGGGGYAFNREAGANSVNQVMSMAVAAPNTYITSLEFDYAMSDKMYVELFSGSSSVFTFDTTAGDATMVWGSSGQKTFGADLKIDRISVSSGPVTVGQYRFAIDNLKYEVASTGPGPTVPEPASFALAAVALAAAGAATRRRQA